MKKKVVGSGRMPAAETLQQDGGKKKSEDEIVQNLFLLYNEFRAIGLPDALNEIVFKELSTLTGEEYTLSFDMRVGRMPVNGRVHLEANGLGSLYTISYYELSLEYPQFPAVRKNSFLCTPFCLVTIEEAVNLLQGRYFYRKPETDPLGEGYWVFLSEGELIPGFRRPLFVRNGFRVREFLKVTGLGSWLGVEGYGKLVHDLEKGYLCDLTLGTGKGMRAVKVEADPAGLRLKVMNGKGVEVGI